MRSRHEPRRELAHVLLPGLVAMAPARERPRAPRRRSRRRRGLTLGLLSAGAFATVAILSQVAFGAGVPALGLVAGRFVLGAAVLWLLVALLRRPLPAPRDRLPALALGVPFGAHAALLAGAYSGLDAGLADLLFFVHPVLVMAGAVAVGRERWNPRATAALAVAGAGLVCTLLVGTGGGFDAAAAMCSLGAAVVYAAFLLGAAGRPSGSDALALTACTATGAALPLAGVAFAVGDGIPLTSAAVTLVAAVAVLGSIVAPATLIASVRHLGPSRAAIMGSAEPVMSGLLGAIVFADVLGPGLLIGAALVLAAIPILESARPTAPHR